MPRTTLNKLSGLAARRYAGVAVAAAAFAVILWRPDFVFALGDAAFPDEYEFQLSGRVVQVADGDTFTLQVNGGQERIRMASIDAPEMGKGQERPGQHMAQASRKALATLISGKRLTLHCYERDHYDRSICDVPLGDGTTANQRQVEQGMAWANMEGRGKFMRDTVLPDLEDQARQMRRGLWSRAGQVPPWQWRYQCWKQSQC